MKPLIASVILCMGVAMLGDAQGKYDKAYVCDNGKIHFYASTPIQDIEATSNNGLCVLNAQTRKISAKIQMTSFVFRRQKMQEDFNEDYAESNKFPVATLEAVITNNINLTKDGTYDVTLKGTLDIHGTKKETEIKGKLVVKNGQPYTATARFDVKLADYNFKIPTIVVEKIAQVVQVDVNFEFKKYQGNI
jgi:hypothetical protein